MTAPGWREQARVAATGAIFDLIGKGSLPLDRGQIADRFAAAALEAAEPLIRAEADSRRIPGSEMYMAGVEAERERITGLAVTHRAVYQDEIGDTREFADMIEGVDQ